MLEETVQIALGCAIRFRAIQIVDSVYCIANVNTNIDHYHQGKRKQPRDPDAHWRVKHTRIVKIEKYKEEKQTE
jgi:hypothetical protein